MEDGVANAMERDVENEDAVHCEVVIVMATVVKNIGPWLHCGFIIVT